MTTPTEPYRNAAAYAIHLVSLDVEVLWHNNDFVVIRGHALTGPPDTYYRLYFQTPITLEWTSVLISEDRAASLILQDPRS